MRTRIVTLVTVIAVIGGAVLVPAAAANAAATAVDDSYTLGAAAPFATPAGSGLLANDSGVPGGAVVQVLIQPQHGKIRALDTATGAFSYQPDDTFVGTDLFTYCIQLGRGCVTDPATVALNVVPHLERIASSRRSPCRLRDSLRG